MQNNLSDITEFNLPDYITFKKCPDELSVAFSKKTELSRNAKIICFVITAMSLVIWVSLKFWLSKIAYNQNIADFSDFFVILFGISLFSGLLITRYGSETTIIIITKDHVKLTYFPRPNKWYPNRTFKTEFIDGFFIQKSTDIPFHAGTQQFYNLHIRLTSDNTAKLMRNLHTKEQAQWFESQLNNYLGK
ncbi:MAG: hypothetical protein MI743_01775 [Sneathiellales bacterium]|nr:hypothetical protein [Sneathiellales bacterium]